MWSATTLGHSLPLRSFGSDGPLRQHAARMNSVHTFARRTHARGLVCLRRLTSAPSPAACHGLERLVDRLELRLLAGQLEDLKTRYFVCILPIGPADISRVTGPGMNEREFLTAAPYEVSIPGGGTGSLAQRLLRPI